MTFDEAIQVIVKNPGTFVIAEPQIEMWFNGVIVTRSPTQAQKVCPQHDLTGEYVRPFVPKDGWKIKTR